jgi:8-oxo-dGTP diphosphatase
MIIVTTFNTYAQPALAVDVVILTIKASRLCCALMRRDDVSPGAYALPGGFVHHGQSLDQTVMRVLAEKVKLKGIAFEQLATYGDPARDPRGHVVSVVYLALAPDAEALMFALPEGFRLPEIRVDWPGERGGPASTHFDNEALPLAFDHASILGDTMKRLRGKIDYTNIAFALLPPSFTLRQVQEVHEAILGRPLLKPAFRRKLLDRGILQETGQMETGGAYRPATLYQLIS